MRFKKNMNVYLKDKKIKIVEIYSMSTSHNQPGDRSNTPTEENARNQRVDQHSESLKVSSVQDYTSGEGQEEGQADLQEGEEVEEYGLQDGEEGEAIEGDQQEGNYADYGDYGEEDAEDFITTDREDGGQRQGREATDDDSSEVAHSETACANRQAAKVVLGKLQAKIERYYEEQVRVPADQIVSIFDQYNKDKSGMDFAKVNQFFIDNEFFSALRGQVDQPAMQEVFKNLKIHHYSAGDTVYRYGSAGQNAYFVLRGKVELKAPVVEEITVKTEKELIKYCADNINNIVWEKVEDGYEMKELAQQYLNDPEGYDNLSRDTGGQGESSFSRGRGSGAQLRHDHLSSARGSGQPDHFAAKLSECASNYLYSAKREEEKSQFMEEELTETFTLFKTIKTHVSRDNFGELALVNTKPRTKTALCTEDTVIVSLSKEIYNRVLEKAVKRDLLGRISFLKNFAIFQNMQQTSLERLLLFMKLKVVQRGKVIYKVGQKPDGVYLIQDGAFELSAPAPLMQHADDNVNRYNIDPMAKFQLKKQASVIKDKSLATIKYAILGKGEVFGLQECQYKPTSSKYTMRQHTVTCVQNDSKVIFINHQAFIDRVLSDVNTEQDIKLETLLKQHFYDSRCYQQQHTIWNGKHIGSDTIEAMQAKQADDDPNRTEDGKEKPTAERTEDAMPKLRTVAEYYKEKFDAEFLSMIVSGMQERTSNSIAEGTSAFKKMVFQKSKEIENYIDVKLNRNQPTARRRKPAKLPPLAAGSFTETSQRPFDSQHPSILTSGEFDRSGSAGIRGAQGNLQEDSILSARPNDISAPQMPMHDQSLHYPDDHYNSQDTRVLHSIVKQKMRPQDYMQKQFIYEDTPGLHIQSDADYMRRHQQKAIDDQSHLANRDLASIVYAQQHERSSNPSSMSPGHQQIVRPTLREDENEQLLSDSANKQEYREGTQPSGTAKSIVVEDNDQSPTNRAPLPSTQLKKDQNKSQPGVGKSIDGVLGTQSMTVDEVTKDEELDNETLSNQQNKKNAMNKTQDQFNPKPKDNLLDEQGRGSNLLTAEDKSKPVEGVLTSPENTEGTDPEKQNKKKYSMVTDNNAGKPETRDPSKSKEEEKLLSSPEKQLSVTTQNPSHLGNIRDPRYSQEMQKTDQQKKKAKKRQVIQSGVNHKSLIKEEADPMLSQEASTAQKTHVHLPKVGRADDSEVGEASQMDKSNSNSPELRDGAHQKRESRNIQKHIRITKVGSPQEFTIDTEDHPTMSKGLDLLRGSLPYDEAQSTAFSGLRGSKRNQIQIARQGPQHSDRNSPKAVQYGKANPSNILSSSGADAGQFFQPASSDIFNNSQSVNLSGGTRHGPDLSMLLQGSTAQSTGGYPLPNHHQYMPQPQGAAQLVGTASSRNQAVDQSQSLGTRQQANQPQQVFVPSQINPRMVKQQLAHHSRNKRNAVHTASSHDPIAKDGYSKRKGKRNGGVIFRSSQGPASRNTRANSSSVGPQHSGHQSSRARKDVDNSLPFGFRGAAGNTAEYREEHILSPIRDRSTQQSASDQGSNLDPNSNSFNLSPSAAAAATELIQNFITNPSQPISTADFLAIQQKYALPPHEAYQLLLQQIQFQKALLQPPTAATVVKVSHHSYTTHVKQKRDEVIQFRNDLFARFTMVRRNSRKRLKQKAAGAQTVRNASTKNVRK